ncbi:MAG TPA: elongation factor EF-2 [Candidatus Bathyarchaeia archaeon]|nr:elongation factor EF-2 [Candidatus Bathyarchaeia archaeon]
MPRFKSSADILKIVSNKDQIRNIGIIAHVDHGKCVDGESMITLSDGRIEEIAQIYEKLRRKGPSMAQVDSLNPRTLKMEDRNVSHVWKLHSNKLVKVTLRNGYSVETTPEHPFFTIAKDGIVRQKRADGIKRNDLVLVPNTLRSIPSRMEEIKSEILEVMSSHQYYIVYLEGRFSEELERLVNDKGMKQVYSSLRSNSSFKAFRAGLALGRIRLDDLVKITDSLRIPRDRVYDHIRRMAYRLSRAKPGRLSNLIKLPRTRKQFQDLAYLLGVLWGDGSNRASFNNGYGPLLETVSQIFQRVFGVSTILVKDKRRNTYRLDHHGGFSLIRFLEDTYQYPTKHKAHNIVFPKLVLKMGNEHVAAFLRGEFDTDGGVERTSAVISLTTASRKFARQVSISLLRFSIIPTIRQKGKYFTITVSGHDTLRFEKTIGFTIPRKRVALHILARKAVSSRKTGIVPIGWQTLREIRNQLGIPSSYLESKIPFYCSYESGRQNLTRPIFQSLVSAFEKFIASRPSKDTAFTLVREWRKLLEGEIRPIPVSEIGTRTGSFDVYDLTVPENHTFIANGIVVHNTTMTDSLLSGAGLLSPSLAGTALAMDFMEEEQKRQMTIKAANVSLYYEHNDMPFVINLIDTPGHVDFSGKVTRSLRAIDGAVVVVDSVEEVMVQTETVTRQALEERVRPVLYINKIDRLIKELKLNPEQIQERVARIIKDFNALLDLYAEPEFREKWKVNFATNTVAMGSAKDRWGFNAVVAKKKGVKFSDVVDAYVNGKVEELKNRAPIHEAILGMAVEVMPPPHKAQVYRIPKIWHGDPDSEYGQAMIKCDDKGPVLMSVTNIVVDPQAGVVATGRLFSGTVTDGEPVFLINSRTQGRVQQVAIYMGPQREIVGHLSAGNIPALLGLENVKAGETLASVKQFVPFEAVHYVTEPVVTIAVEPKYNRDLPKLVEILRKLSLEDPNLVTSINEETGEYLISGMGTLHLEIANTLITKTGMEIVTSKPIVIYREAVRREAGPVEGKSPNKHNKIYIEVEPLEDAVLDLIKQGKLSEYGDKAEMAKLLRGVGWEPEEARGVWSIDEPFNMILDVTKGAQYVQEVKDMILAGYRWGIKEGPIAYEQIRGLKVKISDVSLHEDPVHRGPAQIMPMTRRAMFVAFLEAAPTLLEPVQKITTRVPNELLGAVTSVITQKRGKIVSVDQKGHLVSVVGEMPTAESFDLSEVMRSQTQGRAFWGLEFARWSPVPTSLLQTVVEGIRKRKGLSLEPPKASDFMEA